MAVDHFFRDLFSLNLGSNMTDQIEKAFTFHEPKYPGKTLCHNQIRDFAKNFAYVIESTCPNSREKSLAMTKLEECVMWANAAIARNE